ncbi:MAG: hypothetical protein COA41_01670 [Sphingopyxis sp.]|nr:MAG: hypothetical protein COA41_01670 [Sphingopyxis sp.]
MFSPKIRGLKPYSANIAARWSITASASNLPIMFAPTRVAIRAEAGAITGSGHFARASAVAAELLLGGDTEVTLITNAEGAVLAPTFFPPNIRVLALTPENDGPEEAMLALADTGWTADVILLDQYGHVGEWEALAARTDKRLLVLDDLNEATQADIIVRTHGETAWRRDSLVLGGPAYLPLSRHITDLGLKPSQSGGPPLRLNICFGGSDPTGETAKALQAVTALTQLAVDVVVGPGTKIDPLLIERSEQLPHVTIYQAPDPRKLAELMFEADLALGAGGVMLWERLSIGVPSLVICVAQNQRPQVDTVVEAGAIQSLGEHTNVTPRIIAEAVTALAADERERQAIVAAGHKLIDGRGALRLASWIRALALGVRDVTAEDAANLLEWRTDDRNWRHNFETTGKPGFDAHVAWLAEKLADPDCIFRILTQGTVAVGVVRFDVNTEDSSAYLSIYLVPQWHGRKMGLPVYLAAERELRRSRSCVKKIVSRIHKANTASERLHRAAGFEISASQTHPDWLDAWKALD